MFLLNRNIQTKSLYCLYINFSHTLCFLLNQNILVLYLYKSSLVQISWTITLQIMIHTESRIRKTIQKALLSLHGTGLIMILSLGILVLLIKHMHHEKRRKHMQIQINSATYHVRTTEYHVNGYYPVPLIRMQSIITLFNHCADACELIVFSERYQWASSCDKHNPIANVLHSRLSWWRHQMETFSALLTLCAGNSPVTGEFPAQRPVTRSFDVFFDLRMIKRLSKHSWGWWFEAPSRSLWRHCNVVIHFFLLCIAGDKKDTCVIVLKPYRLLVPTLRKCIMRKFAWKITKHESLIFVFLESYVNHIHTEMPYRSVSVHI